KPQSFSPPKSTVITERPRPRPPAIPRRAGDHHPQPGEFQLLPVLACAGPRNRRDHALRQGPELAARPYLGSVTGFSCCKLGFCPTLLIRWDPSPSTLDQRKRKCPTA